MKNMITFGIGILITIILVPILLVQCDITYKNNTHKDKVVSDKTVHVYMHETKKVEAMDLEEYIKGVVSGEMPASFEMEALKAQAVAARSYAISRMNAFKESKNPNHPDAELCDTVHCQVFLSKDKLMKIKSKEWLKDSFPKIEKAVEDTRGMIMTYEGEPIKQPLFHSTSGGKTENSEDVFAAWVPYLRSVESPYENNAPHLKEQVSIPIQTFIKKIKTKHKGCVLYEKNLASQIKILTRSDGGRVLKMKIGNQETTGRDIRERLGLRSANFTFYIKDKNIHFTTLGYGHGVGMSQWGANGMAQEGSTYDEILKHYYVGVEIAPIQ